MKKQEITFSVNADTTPLDQVIEKTNRLKELLSEVNSIIGSLDKININFEVNSES